MMNERHRIVAALGTAQTLAWASSQYLPAILAVPMARELRLAPSTIFAAFSLAHLVSAAAGPASGRWIDRHGGRGLLMATSGLFAAGLVALAMAEGPAGVFIAWLVLGVAMGAGLYDAAFAALTALYGRDARGTITGVTLLGGFASTIGWPLTAWMEARWGWRGACLGWGALHLVLGLPLNALLPGASRLSPRAMPAGAEVATGHAAGDAAGARDASAGAEAPLGAGPPPAEPARRQAWLLAFVFAAMGCITMAMAAHLPRLLEAAGATAVAALFASTLMGPAQVAGRLVEVAWLKRAHPLVGARLATLGTPIGVIAVLGLGPAAAPAFSVLYGLGNGIMTIARGTLPLALFGARGYGRRQGWLVMPARVVSALAPWAMGLALDAWGAATLWITLGLSLASLAALLAVRAVPPGR